MLQWTGNRRRKDLVQMLINLCSWLGMIGPAVPRRWWWCWSALSNPFTCKALLTCESTEKKEDAAEIQRASCVTKKANLESPVEPKPVVSRTLQSATSVLDFWLAFQSSAEELR
jgi:hypothetical protein